MKWLLKSEEQEKGGNEDGVALTGAGATRIYSMAGRSGRPGSCHARTTSSWAACN